MIPAPWRELVVPITTLCNRRCPDCVYRIPKNGLGPRAHASWEWFEFLAKWFKGMPLVIVSGGEPTLHPEFDRISREFRKLFQTERLVCTSNGARVLRHADVVDCYDEWRITPYVDVFTQDAIEYLRRERPALLQSMPTPRVHMEAVGGGKACVRRRILIAVGERLWPCCVGPGLHDAPSTDISEGWEERIQQVPLPCERCPFSLDAEERV